jgi:ribose/xylose/arabinose/galactoside ABC-type transport system permease subunit
MNRTQKIAWFRLIIIALALIASVIFSLLDMRKYDCSFAQAWWFGTVWPVIISILLITLFSIISPFLINKDKTISDERDLLIQRRASRFGYTAATAFFVISIITITTSMGDDKTIPTYWLLRLFLGGWYTMIIAEAITILVCYKFGLINGRE